MPKKRTAEELAKLHRFLVRHKAICDEDGRATASAHAVARRAEEALLQTLRSPSCLTDDELAVLEILASGPGGWKLRGELWPELQREYPDGGFGLQKVGSLVRRLIDLGFACRQSDRAPVCITQAGRDALAGKNPRCD